MAKINKDQDAAEYSGVYPHLLDASISLRRHLHRRLRDPAVAEDIAQDVYGKLRGVDLSTVRDPISYVLKVASRASSDYLRHERRTGAIDDCDLPSSDGDVEAQRERVLLAYVMQQLPALEREALKLHASGLTAAEIASRLALSRERTYRLLTRALAHASSHLWALRQEPQP